MNKKFTDDDIDRLNDDLTDILLQFHDGVVEISNAIKPYILDINSILKTKDSQKVVDAINQAVIDEDNSHDVKHALVLLDNALRQAHVDVLLVLTEYSDSF